MIKLELELHDVDYDALIRNYLPRVREMLEKTGSPLASTLSGPFAETLLLRSPDSVKEKLCAELLNANSAALERRLEELAAQNGLRGTVKNVRAEAGK